MGYCFLVVISNSRAQDSASKDRNELLATGPIEKSAQEKTGDHSALQTNTKIINFLVPRRLWHKILLIVVLSENCSLHDESVLLAGLLT